MRATSEKYMHMYKNKYQHAILCANFNSLNIFYIKLYIDIRFKARRKYRSYEENIKNKQINSQVFSRLENWFQCCNFLLRVSSLVRLWNDFVIFIWCHQVTPTGIHICNLSQTNIVSSAYYKKKSCYFEKAQNLNRSLSLNNICISNTMFHIKRNFMKNSLELWQICDCGLHRRILECIE